jgi:hypothetical protein
MHLLFKDVEMADNRTGKAIKIVVRDGKAIAYCAGTAEEPLDVVHQWKDGPIRYTQVQDDETNNKTKREIAVAWSAFSSERVRKQINTAVDLLTLAVMSADGMQLTQVDCDSMLAKIDAAKKKMKKRIVKTSVAKKLENSTLQPASETGVDPTPENIAQSVPDSIAIVHEPVNSPQ